MTHFSFKTLQGKTEGRVRSRSSIANAFLAFGLTLAAGSAAMGQDIYYQSLSRAEPRPLAAFSIAARQVEIAAVTRYRRADTPLRREYLEESLNMGKVIPGYPQPAFVSFDFRVRF